MAKVTCVCQQCGKSFEVYPSDFKLGRGKYCSDKCNGESKRGKHISEETRAKISEAHRGKTVSEETRAKMSEAKSGENHPMYGRRTGEFRICPVCGTEFYVTQSQIAKNYGTYCSRACYMNGKEPTWIEKATMEVLDEWGIEYEYQFYTNDSDFSKWYDFYFEVSGSKILVETDGTYWHSTDEAKLNDELKDEWAIQNGYTILRYSESDISKAGMKQLLGEDIGVNNG